MRTESEFGRWGEKKMKNLKHNGVDVRRLHNIIHSGLAEI